MLSTIHEPIMVLNRKVSLRHDTEDKTSVCEEYNENRGLVDKYDMQISFTECIRRSESGTKSSSFIWWTLHFI
jgi:hypothetical protein